MSYLFLLLFFFNDTAPTEIYTLSLHDALPISLGIGRQLQLDREVIDMIALGAECDRSEEHTSELQSLTNLVCRLLLEKKKKHTKKKNNKTVKNTKRNSINASSTHY